MAKNNKDKNAPAASSATPPPDGLRGIFSNIKIKLPTPKKVDNDDDWEMNEDEIKAKAEKAQAEIEAKAKQEQEKSAEKNPQSDNAKSETRAVIEKMLKSRRTLSTGKHPAEPSPRSNHAKVPGKLKLPVDGAVDAMLRRRPSTGKQATPQRDATHDESDQIIDTNAPPIISSEQFVAPVQVLDDDKKSENNPVEEEIVIEDLTPLIQPNGVEIEHDLLAAVLPIVDRQVIENLKGKTIIDLRKEFVDGTESRHLRSLLNDSKIQDIFPHTEYAKIKSFVAAIEHAKNGKELSKTLINNSVHVDQVTINSIYAEKLMRAAITDALARIIKGSKKLDKYNKQANFPADKAKAVIAERNGLSVLVNYFQYKWDKILNYVASQPRIGFGFRKLTAMFLDSKMTGGNKRTVDEIIDPDVVMERNQRARPVLSDQAVSSKEESIQVTTADMENNRLLVPKLFTRASEKLKLCEEMRLLVANNGSEQAYDKFVTQLTAISSEIDELKESVMLTAEQEVIFDNYENDSQKILNELAKATQRKEANVEPVKVDYLNILVDLLKLLPKISKDKHVQAEFILENFSHEINALNSKQQLPLLREAINKISNNEVPDSIKEIFFATLDKIVPSLPEQKSKLNTADRVPSFTKAEENHLEVAVLLAMAEEKLDLSEKIVDTEEHNVKRQLDHLGAQLRRMSVAIDQIIERVNLFPVEQYVFDVYTQQAETILNNIGQEQAVRNPPPIPYALAQELKVKHPGIVFKYGVEAAPVETNNPASDKSIKEDFSIYSQPGQKPIRDPQTQKDQIKTELELSHYGRIKIEIPDLFAVVDDIKKNIPERLRSMVQRKSILKIVSDEKLRSEAWSDYRNSFDKVVEVYEKISELSITTKAEYEEKLKTTTSQEARGIIKDHYEPILATLNESEILLYKEMTLAEIVELRELENDKSKLERRLAENISMSDDELRETKAEIQSIKNNIAELPEDLKANYAKAKSNFVPGRRGEPRIVEPVMPASDLDMLRGATRLLSSLGVEIRGEILIDLFRTPEISGVDKLRQLKQHESEWFSNLPEQFQWITAEQMKIMRETVDIVLGNKIVPVIPEPYEEQSLMQAPAQSIPAEDTQKISIPAVTRIHRYRQPEPAMTRLEINNYPRELPAKKVQESQRKNKDGYYLLSAQLENPDWNGLFEMTSIDMRYLENILRSGHVKETLMKFWDALSDEKKVEIINSMTNYNELIGVLGALPADERSAFLKMIPLSKLKETITNPVEMSCYLKGLYALGLDDVVKNMNHDWIKSTIQNDLGLDMFFDYVPAKKIDEVLDLFWEDYLAERVSNSQELAKAVSVLVRYDHTEKIQRIDNDIVYNLVKNETDLRVALSSQSIVEKGYFISLISKVDLNRIADHAVNADCMAAAMSSLPEQRLDELFEYKGEAWVREILFDITDAKIFSGFISRLSPELHEKFLNDGAILLAEERLTLANITNADDFLQIAYKIKMTQGDQGVASLLSNNQMRRIFDSIHDVNQLTEFFRILPNDFKLSDYLTTQSAIIQSMTSHHDLVNILNSLRDNEKKEEFLKIAGPDIFNRLSEDIYDVHELLDLLRVLPSEKARASFVTKTDIFNRMNVEVNSIYSLSKLQNFEKVVSKLTASNENISNKKLSKSHEITLFTQPSHVQRIINFLLFSAAKRGEKKISMDIMTAITPRQEVLVFDMEKMLSGALPEARKSAINSMAAILRNDDIIRELHINLTDLSASEVATLAAAFKARALNKLPAISRMDLRGSDNCKLETIDEFLREIKQLLVHDILYLDYSIPLSQQAKIDAEVEHYVKARIGLDRKVSSTQDLPSLDACQSVLMAYERINKEFNSITYFSKIKFDGEKSKLHEMSKIVIERNNLVNINTLDQKEKPVVLTVKIPENEQPDIQVLSPLSLGSPDRDDSFNFQTTEIGLPNESPRSFSFDNADRMRTEIISDCDQYARDYKMGGNIGDLEQLKRLAEIVEYLGFALDDEVVNKINQTLKSINILNFTELHTQINSGNRGEVAQWIADIMRNSKHVCEVELPYNDFSEKEIKPIADVFFEAEPGERIKVLTLNRVNNNNPDSEGVALITPILKNLQRENAKTSVIIVNPYPLSKLEVSGFLSPKSELAALHKQYNGLITFDNHTNSKVGINNLTIRGPSMFKGQLTRHNQLDPLIINKTAAGKKIK